MCKEVLHQVHKTVLSLQCFHITKLLLHPNPFSIRLEYNPTLKMNAAISPKTPTYIYNTNSSYNRNDHHVNHFCMIFLFLPFLSISNSFIPFVTQYYAMKKLLQVAVGSTKFLISTLDEGKWSTTPQVTCSLNVIQVNILQYYSYLYLLYKRPPPSASQSFSLLQPMNVIFHVIMVY